VLSYTTGKLLFIQSASSREDKKPDIIIAKTALNYRDLLYLAVSEDTR